MWEADDLQVSHAAMARTEVNAEMATFFVGLEGWAPTRISFYLSRSSTWRTRPPSRTMTVSPGRLDACHAG
jgi:hypothetical protein